MRAERQGVRRTGRNRVLCPTLKEAQPHVLGPDDLLSGPWPLSGSTEKQKPTPMLPRLDPGTWKQTLPVAAGRTRKTKCNLKNSAQGTKCLKCAPAREGGLTVFLTSVAQGCALVLK